jgi:hypothetical protein
MRKFSVLVLILVAIGIGYWKQNQNIKQQAIAAEQAQLERPRTDEEIRQAIRQSLNSNDLNANAFNQSTPTKQNSLATSAAFTCDGRTHCSSMRSYEEAKFFLDNCPGTKMDGDGDGEPCESQFNR